MIVWFLRDLYHKNLKDLKGFIRFERTLWILKNTFKITRVNEKNNKKWWGLNKKKVKSIYIF